MNRLAVALLFLYPSVAFAGVKSKPIKVFILVGQSNMQGQAKLTLAEYQAVQPKTRELYAHLRKDGKWIARDDVWIKYLDRKGKLAVGFGGLKTFGPEVGFGKVVGDHYAEPVLLIKTAWGGRSLNRDFRSPSAGLPPPKVLEQLLANQQKKKKNLTLDDIKKTYGATYRDMRDDVNGTLANIKTHFPDYAGQGYDLAGFVWFQGWNDMINADATAEYTSNMAHFINDVRKDFKAPKLPFVIGEMGVDGKNASANVKKFKAAQSAVLKMPEFQGNVAVVKTDAFWDMEADAIFKKGWSKYLEEWNKVGSDRPYHYLGSAKTMLGIGQAFGEAVLELRGEKKSK